VADRDQRGAPARNESGLVVWSAPGGSSIPSGDSAKRPLLFLAQRLPFPPTKGDKVRSFAVLRHLSRSWRVLLGCFVDDPDDLRHLEAVSELCAASCIVPIDRRLPKHKSIRSNVKTEVCEDAGKTQILRQRFRALGIKPG
jgi:hypothetical protein